MGEKVKVECQICGKKFVFSTEEWGRWQEENSSDTDRGDGGFVCTDCLDWRPWEEEPVVTANEDGCWETHTGTHYPSLDSVPWQAQGSAVLVECDGTGPAHGRR